MFSIYLVAVIHQVSGSDDIFGSLLRDALALHKIGDNENALSEYDKLEPYLLNTSPSTSALVYGNKGAIYLQLGHYDLAKESFTRAVERDPENINANFNLAVTLSTKLKMHTSAVRHIGVVLRNDPRHFKALHLLGNIMQSIGKHADAERYYKMAASIVKETETGMDDQLKTFDFFGDGLENVVSAKIGDEFSASSEGDRREVFMKCISESPLVFRLPAFLTDDECDEIIARAAPLFEKSHVTGGGHEDGRSSRYRSSENAWLPADKVLQNVQERLANLLGMNDLEHQKLQASAEELQVIKYGVNGFFNVHHDSHSFHKRSMTLLMYLNTPSQMQCSSDTDNASGGTWFPFMKSEKNGDMLDRVDVESIDDANLRAQDKTKNDGDEAHVLMDYGHIELPLKGNALLFFNHLPNGDIDPFAVHSGLPVNSAATDEFPEKFAANFWFGGI